MGVQKKHMEVEGSAQAVRIGALFALSTTLGDIERMITQTMEHTFAANSIACLLTLSVRLGLTKPEQGNNQRV
jgi:hypothetical protein